MRWPIGSIRALLFFTLFIVAGPSLANGQEGEENTDLKIEIISPSDGEIFYAGKLGYIVSLPITGFITSANSSPESADVQLTIWSVHGSSEPLHTQPDKNGYFAFYLDLNPDNEPLPSVGERFFYYSERCADCHFATDNALPLGPLRLEFKATAADGQIATAEKRVTVDRSQYATIPVKVVLEGMAETTDGIPIQAETRLYEWRGRRFKALTDDSGLAELRVEALSQRATRYLVSVPPTLIDNRRFRSLNTTEVVIPPGMATTEIVEMVVVVENGAITGSVATDSSLSPGAAMAIALPSGYLYQEEIQENNTFAFTGLPLGEYLVSVASREDRTKDEVAPAEHVDLVESATAEVLLALDEKPGVALAGQLVDETGLPIPFGWLTVDDGSQSEPVSPVDGRFLLDNVKSEQATINITAPGFWSQSNTLSEWASLAGQAGGSIKLTPRNDNKDFVWGTGHILIPQESILVEKDDALSLVRGWIWGQNKQSELVTINMEGIQIEVEAADFALEYAPGNVSWIYVTDGRVTYTSREGTVTAIEAGEMMAFGDGVPAPYPVGADELAIGILRNGRTPTVPLLHEEEPSTAQRIGEALASAGRNLSQVLVAITYLIMFLMIIGAILYGARRLIRTWR